MYLHFFLLFVFVILLVTTANPVSATDYSKVKLEINQATAHEAENSQLLVLDITIKNSSNEPISISHDYFSLESGGNYYSALTSFNLEYCNYVYDTLNPSISKKYTLCFETPKKISGGSLTLYDRYPSICKEYGCSASQAILPKIKTLSTSSSSGAITFDLSYLAPNLMVYGKVSNPIDGKGVKITIALPDGSGKKIGDKQLLLPNKNGEFSYSLQTTLVGAYSVTVEYEEHASITKSINLASKTATKQKSTQQPTTQKAETLKLKLISITNSNKDIITNSNFQTVQNQPDKFKNKWAKLSGQVFQDSLDYGDQGIWTVFDYSQGDSLVSTSTVWLQNNKNIKFTEGDCIMAEGKIKGSSALQYQFTGAKHDIPLIGLEKVKKITCLEAKYPATSYVTVNKSITKNNIKVIIHKIEFSQWHTRVFASVENLSNNNEIYFNEFDSKIVQDKRQFKPEFAGFVEFDGIEYDISPGVIEEGAMIFKPIQPKSFELELNFNDQSFLKTSVFKFTITI